MTRPMQETRDKVAETQYATRQLQRRPAPVSAAGAVIPVLVARQQTTFTTGIVSGNVTALLWDQYDNSDTSVFDVNLTGGSLNTVDLLVPGLFTFTCAIEWSTNGDWRTNIFLAGSYDNDNQVTHAGQAGGNSGTVFFSTTILMPAPFESGPASPPPWATVQWLVLQNSGSNRATDLGTYMQIAYHGTTTHTPEET